MWDSLKEKLHQAGWKTGKNIKKIQLVTSKHSMKRCSRKNCRLHIWSELQYLKGTMIAKTGPTIHRRDIDGDDFARIVLTVAYAITNQCAFISRLGNDEIV